ncbi:hypothetical protein VST7929_00018 [Vibrio stylophorae]|uniref:HTH cro/C1-type domain-containing protein n=1 Tax=Vibrio stylophorae TaxID=659351 RepID=A0ABM8ZQN1_9VIBR|nr:helix-turn-helix transcriptional regulator [Vibrio stylophorae]CAH0532207.1 hypothetical protein VST7929_00018 [Vibrio stylophorae]
MTDPKTQLASRIREAREWKGITQVHMAKQLEVARQTYLDLESGKTEPRISTLLTIANLTDRPLTWFVYGDDSPHAFITDNQDALNTLLSLSTQVPENLRQTLLEQNIRLLSSFIDANK